MRKYDLRLTAATFLIIDPNSASVELACQWQKCMGGQVQCRQTHFGRNCNKLECLSLVNIFTQVVLFQGSPLANVIKLSAAASYDFS